MAVSGLRVGAGARADREHVQSWNAELRPMHALSLLGRERQAIQGTLCELCTRDDRKLLLAVLPLRGNRFCRAIKWQLERPVGHGLTPAVVFEPGVIAGL